jgi:hypothetical protein
LLHGSRLHGKKAEQHRKQAQEYCRSHLPTRPHRPGFAARR